MRHNFETGKGSESQTREYEQYSAMGLWLQGA